MNVGLIWQSTGSGGMFDGIASRMPVLSQLGAEYGFRLHQKDIEEIAKLDVMEHLHLVDAGLDDRDVEVLSKLTKLKTLDLRVNPEITDQGLAHLARLTALTALILDDNPKIIDAGVSHLASLQGLKAVGLIDTSITDEACKTLAALPLLEHVTLNGTRITDSGLETLSTIKTLNRLDLAGCKRITDQGLTSLAKIPSLTYLAIQNNPQLTEPAVRKLQAALPKCLIVSNFPNIAPPQPAAEMKPAADPDRAVAE